MYVRDGFPGQRRQVLPGPVMHEALQQAPTSVLLTTDAGYFPHADHHGRRRSHGAKQAVVIVCTAGRGGVESEGATAQIRTGQALVIGPGIPHLYYADAEDPWTIWWVHIAGIAVAPFMSRLGADRRPVVLDLENTGPLVNEIAQIVMTMESEASQDALPQAATHAWQVLTHLVANQVGGHARSEPVVTAQQYLRDHLTEPVRVPELAAMVGLSPSHFTTVFRAATGTGVIDYLTRLRMARARELLGLTDEPVAGVAAAAGFTDPFYFSRRFRALHGCSPSQFRASLRRDNL